jgi:hypothetical protein
MIEDIIERLRFIPQSIPTNTNDSAWTKSIKRALGKLGEQKGYKICAAGIDDYEREWLYDLVWYKEDSCGFLVSIPLVMESEWDRKYSGIKYDFEKLLLSKSSYKIMIFQATGADQYEYFEKLKSSIARFHADSICETYLLACFDEISYEFKFEVISNNKKQNQQVDPTVKTPVESGKVQGTAGHP